MNVKKRVHIMFRENNYNLRKENDLIEIKNYMEDLTDDFKTTKKLEEDLTKRNIYIC